MSLTPLEARLTEEVAAQRQGLRMKGAKKWSGNKAKIEPYKLPQPLIKLWKGSLRSKRQRAALSPEFRAQLTQPLFPDFNA